MQGSKGTQMYTWIPRIRTELLPTVLFSHLCRKRKDEKEELDGEKQREAATNEIKESNVTDRTLTS